MFRSKCFHKLLPPGDKLHTRAYSCIFVGFSPGQKGYKVYDLDNHKIVVSKDVKFITSELPETKEDSPLTNSPLNAPPVSPSLQRSVDQNSLLLS